MVGKSNKTYTVVRSHDIELDNDYIQWIYDVKQRFRSTQIKAAVKVNSEQLPAPQGKLAQEMLKENYDLGFVSLPAEYDETALEDAIEQRMTRFLLELGDGWAFVGRQKELIIAGKTRKIDLLFTISI
ncbi:MAG: DUF1016 domain-containing protein [Coprococcus sp.]|nr:DUF1016 domain-containing protein [Coprococcus sp.]